MGKRNCYKYIRKDVGRVPYEYIKRLIDMCIASILLIISGPIFLIIAIAIKLEDGGSIFYFQKRVGQSNKLFRIIKFRSMYEGSENIKSKLTSEQYTEFIKEYKLKNDPRRTKVGVFLRESKLDELPQLLNVITGQMAMVGPRPVTLSELKYYTAEEKKCLLCTKPGLTGLWQINDRQDISYENRKRQAMELFYVKHSGFLLDSFILLKTIIIVICKVIISVLNIKKEDIV